MMVRLIVKLIVEHQKQPLSRLKSKPEQHGWTPRRSATPPTLWAAHFVPLNASLRLQARHVSTPAVPSQDPPQKSGCVHALLTTCLSMRFTSAQIGWTPPGFCGGSWLFEQTRGLRPQAITTPWAVLIQLGLYLITRLPQELNHERVGRSMIQLKSKSA